MELRILIAGSGGQGILFLGKAIALASMMEGKEVTWFPSYGAEMRGGTANCTVITSENMIGSPVIETCDILITMNSASLEKFQPRLRRRGLLFYDSSLVSCPPVRRGVVPVPIPATEAAGACATTKAANMVMLGAVIARTGLVMASSVEHIFERQGDTMKSRGSDINRAALRKGLQYGADSQGSHT